MWPRALFNRQHTNTKGQLHNSLVAKGQNAKQTTDKMQNEVDL